MGAGRKPGNAVRRSREVADRAAESGSTPLEYLLAVVANPEADQKRRDWAAATAAPFCHPRLNATTIAAPSSGNRVMEINIISVPSGKYIDPDDPTQTRF